MASKPGVPNEADDWFNTVIADAAPGSAQDKARAEPWEPLPTVRTAGRKAVNQAREAMKTANKVGMVGTGPGYSSFEAPTAGGRVVGSPPETKNPYKESSSLYKSWERTHSAARAPHADFIPAPSMPSFNHNDPKSMAASIVKSIQADGNPRAAAALWLSTLTTEITGFIRTLDDPDEDDE